MSTYRIVFSQVILLIGFSMIVSCKQEKEEPIMPDNKDLTHIAYNPARVEPPQPATLPIVEVPLDNQLTAEGIELGRRLFYDKILSGDSTMSCAGCHFPQFAFTDQLPVSKGIDGVPGTRSAMSLVNLAYVNEGLFWDGRSTTLEEQALIPVEDVLELHAEWENVEEKLRNHPDYPALFRKAFGIHSTDQITRHLAAKAIAQFERMLISADSKYDRVIRGEAFFTDEELNGFELFFDVPNDLPDAECGHCHNAPLFTTNQFFNNGLDSAATLEDFKDKGLGGVNGNLFDNGKFRAPTLRNIALTAPYMHDGRFETLEEVIDHYNKNIHFADNLDPLLQQPEGLGLTEQHKKDLIAFLHALTDTSFTNNPAFQNPFKE